MQDIRWTYYGQTIILRDDDRLCVVSKDDGISLIPIACSPETREDIFVKGVRCLAQSRESVQPSTK